MLPTLPLSSPEFVQSLALSGLEPILRDWRYPLGIGALYLAAVTVINPTRGKPTSSKLSGPLFTAAVFLHNLSLCIFSAWVFLGTAPIYARNLFREPSIETWCDVNGSFWAESLGYFTWVFYLSKYWEILDTVVLLAKGKKSSLLQSYHHFGAIVCMHINFYTSSTAVTFFVLFNSFIHTLMYAYFSLMTIGIRPPGKKYLTRMQISQFLVGMTSALSFLVFEAMKPGSCLRDPKWNRRAILVNVAYLIPLTYLFVDFFVRTYYGRATSQQPKKTVSGSTKSRKSVGVEHLKEE
ncbi:ELO family [Catenaria anguillulae PL171]|uniref:Elongation of fatty acids protein n=1 Tax=Catenaria anguillulae PL171 TaxID=765915 RepID=A0A1Y2I143_9FUNG|nr:ELO family [Catenaria anguillulae PL171]